MAVIRKRIGQNGRLGIPTSYRRALGVKPGDELVLVLGDGEVRILARGTAIKRAQAVVRRFVPKNRRLSDELIKDRRAEASRDAV
ncbi:MAG: AbrB/MazE/SpoVT family DNA-binding domain-containing protein [Chloroflexi bacterium]|nr:MAG: AbrB/MazE/SpoVT family DNA-binding domain-containing protein [Chloroflexota bacterium]